MRALRLAHALLRLGGRKASRRFLAGVHAPQERQSAILRRLLAANRDSRYGQQYGFSDLSTPEQYQDALPVVDYDALLPWIEGIKQGVPGVLTTEPVLMLEKSGGSTAASKYIPYTESLRSEFQAATSAWLHDLTTHRSRLRRAGAYFSVSPGAQRLEVTQGGLRVGFEDDTEYFGMLERWVLGQILLTPAGLGRVPSIAANRYVTLRHLLDSEDLGLVSVWNPSFLTLLLRELELQGDRLVRDLREGTLTPPSGLTPELQAALARGLRRRPRTADRLETLLHEGRPLMGPEVWPNLQLISCWTDAMAGRSLVELEARFPGVEIQGKGLLATEGVISFPLLDQPGAALAIDSHFYEFVPAGDLAGDHTGDRTGDSARVPASRPKLAHELDVGGRYSVLLTTGGGLYRYALGDMVEVVGKLSETPFIRFLGKTGKISDLVGEKLNELHVASALDAALAARGLAAPFAMLAPRWGEPPSYQLFVHVAAATSDLEALASDLDGRLREAHHYAYARDLGQLGAISVVPLDADANAVYLQACEARGQKLGNIKPVALHLATDWSERFACCRLSGA